MRYGRGVNSLPLVTCVALAACHAAPTGPRLPHGPLASSVAAWIPADAAVVIAIGPRGSAELDDVTTALGWIGPGLLATIDPVVTTAWQGAAIAPRGAMWILWDDDARSTATCAVAGNAARIADALVAAGGTRQVSHGAFVVELGDTTTVLRDGVACVVESGARTRTAHHALRLAALTDEDRLLTTRHDDAALLRSLPEGDVVLLGKGELIGGLIEVVPGLATQTLAGDTPAIALSIEPASHHVVITIASTVNPQAPARPDHGSVSPGTFALRVPRERRPDVPLPAKDENSDVPGTDAYRAAEHALAASLAGAIDLGQRLDNLEDAARAAFDRAWGSVSWVRRADDRIETVTATWTPPTWPAAELRAAAEAAEAHAREGEDELRALYQRAIEDVAAKIAARTSVRAKDVAAWDRAHRVP